MHKLFLSPADYQLLQSNFQHWSDEVHRNPRAFLDAKHIEKCIHVAYSYDYIRAYYPQLLTPEELWVVGNPEELLAQLMARDIHISAEPLTRAYPATTDTLAIITSLFLLRHDCIIIQEP